MARGNRAVAGRGNHPAPRRSSGREQSPAADGEMYEGPLAWCGPSTLRRRLQYTFTRPDLWIVPGADSALQPFSFFATAVHALIVMNAATARTAAKINASLRGFGVMSSPSRVMVTSRTKGGRKL